MMNGSSWAKAMPCTLALLSDASLGIGAEKAHLGIQAFLVFFDSLLTAGTELL